MGDPRRRRGRRKTKGVHAQQRRVSVQRCNRMDSGGDFRVHANDDDASYVTQECATCVDGVLGDSDGGTDDEFDGGRSQRARPTEDEDPGTPPFPTRRGLAPPTPQFGRGVGCDSRSSAPLCLGVHERGRSRSQSRGCGGAQTVARVAPRTTAAPVNGATLAVAGGTADIIRDEVTVPFPPSGGCLKLPHTRAALKRMSEPYSTDCLEEAAGAGRMEKAMGLQTVGAVARREHANAGPPKARTVSLAQLWLLCVGVG
eukprot:jgi/Undpi1/7874/HiC_scaffold_24.g10346.m1